ncbi:MAG: hypothetical protein KDB90_02485 [Planctomycetes bacterium]|nr:hypothetical protein [Planctomycetota bacterium]
MKTLIHTSLLLMTLLATPLVAESAWKVTDGPGAISEHAMIRDIRNDRMIVFGGLLDGALSNRVFAYYPNKDGFAEILAYGVAPSPRRETLAVYDEKRDRMIVFGGATAEGNTNDAFALYLTPGKETWQPLAIDDEVLPPVRSHGVMIVDRANDRVVMHGGYDSPSVLQDVWALSLSEGQESWGGGPLVTTGSSGAVTVGDAAIYDPIGQRMIVFRGYDSSLMELSLNRTPTWATLPLADGPANSRRYPAAAYDPLRHRIIVQGGLDGAMTLTETLSIDLDTLVCKQLAAELDSDGRFWHAAAFDESRDEFIMVGGKDESRIQNATMGLLHGEIDAPELLGPIGEVLLEGEQVSLAWAEAKGATNYMVEIQRADGGPILKSSEIEIEGTTATVTLIDQQDTDRRVPVPYVWRVMGFSKLTVGEFSKYGEFVHVASPEEVTPEVPENDGTGIGAGSGATDDTISGAESGATDDTVSGAGNDSTDDTVGGAGSDGTEDAAKNVGNSSADVINSESDDVTLANGTNRTLVELKLEPVGQGEVAGKEAGDNAAGCVGGNAGEGLSLSLLALVILGVGLRTVRKARRA